MSKSISKSQHHRFKSERVVEGWYYPTSKEIILQFPDGVKWWYRGCSQMVWDRLVDAPSAGHFLASTLNSFRNGPV